MIVGGIPFLTGIHIALFFLFASMFIYTRQLRDRDQEALEDDVKAVARANANRYIPDALHKSGASSVLQKGSPDVSVTNCRTFQSSRSK